ncbi:Hypothetical predicted protein, partial [Marmota monax]
PFDLRWLQDPRRRLKHDVGRRFSRRSRAGENVWTDAARLPSSQSPADATPGAVRAPLERDLSGAAIPPGTASSSLSGSRRCGGSGRT